MIAIPYPEHRADEYSSKVRIWLEVGDVCVSVAKVGEESLVLASSSDATRFDLGLLGRLIVTVDDSRIAYHVAMRARHGKVIQFTHCDDEVGFSDAGVPF